MNEIDKMIENLSVIENALELAKDTLEKFQWISVEDRWPKDLMRVLISCDEGICTGKLYIGQWQCDPIGSYAGDGCVFNVTHWMHLPEGPE